MEFRVLGPLEVVDEGRPVTLDRKRLRALLGFFLLHANELVTSDRLIDEVWGPEPPKTAGASLQNHISRLRKALGADTVLSQPGGYMLRVDPERYDLARFERLTAEARGTAARERADKLRAALSLWRGPALEDLAFEPFAQDEVRRLEEARLAALEERIDADLELGRDDLVGELEELVDRHPLRERFRGQLMHALYRAGRQADALAEYQKARSVLMDELGLEPSEKLRALQQAILRQDASLGAAEVSAAERTSDRRTVTVLFCDLEDSTGLASRLDPEAYRTLMERYFTAVRAPIERHGGTIEKFIGDAVMAAFGVPELHEDDALRAVRAAAEVQNTLRELDELAAAEWDVRLAGRIGVNSGEVHVLSGPGEDLRISGAAVSLASKLEEQAPRGEILLGAGTLELVRDAVRVEPQELGDVPAWRLVEVVADAPGFARRLDVPLVGRDQELTRLKSTYEQALEDGRCRVVTVIGEAGIGKTRLARELVAPLREDARVLVGRCVSYGEGATYLPIADVIRQVAPEGTLAAIRARLGDEDDADAVAHRVAELTGITETPAAPGEAFWAIRRLLETLARERPLVVALDDIHWAEPTLLDLVEYLGKWAEGPILILCLARPDLLEARPGWGGPTSAGFVVELEPLSAETVGALVEELAAQPVDPAVRARIVEHAGGNPLFAEQLLALAAEAPEETLERPPPSIEALIASRLDHLDPRELSVLRRAAVVGRRFSPAELQDLAPGEDSSRQLHALAERGLVHPVQDLFRFHHVLVRDVAYRGIPKSERAELHELAARGLDRRDGVDELIGYHFEQAHRHLVELARPDQHALELGIAAGERLGRAGVRAWKRADAPAAVTLLQRATNLLPEGAAPRAELLCELGAALRVVGDWDRAGDVLEDAARASHAVSNEAMELRARMELIHNRTHHTLDDDPKAVVELVELAKTAIPVFEEADDHRALGRAWVVIGHVEGNFHLRYAALEGAAEQAIHHYRTSGWSPSSSLAALMNALYYGPRPVPDAIARSEALLHDYTGDPASEANILQWLGGLEAMRGQSEKGRRDVAAAKEIYESLGLRLAVGDGCALVSADIELLAGRLEAAEGLLRSACATCLELSESTLIASRAAQLADVLCSLGRIDDASEWAATSRKQAHDEDLHAQVSWRAAAARIAARTHDPTALRLIDEAEEMLAHSDGLNQRAKLQLDRADVCTFAGRPDEARRAAKAALELYEAKENDVAAAACRELLAIVPV